jgi:ubiquinone/menaquinone biosynthesis C-methylase UbiE
MKNYLVDHKDENKRLDFQNKIDVYNLDKELDFFCWNKDHLVLDAGCGNGNVVEKLLDAGLSKIHGVDFSQDRVNQASERFTQHKDVRFFQRSLEDTKFNTNTYDKVICRYVYEHVTAPTSIINELHRVLKPSGEINIINFDDIFFGFYTKNEKFNDQLKDLKAKIPQDFEIARKLPHLLKTSHFKNIVWDAQSYFFKGERLALEIENNKMRLAQGRIHLSKYFSSVDVYDQFAEAYIEEMKDDCNVLYTTKYLIKGNK